MAAYQNQTVSRALGIFDVLLDASRGMLLTEIAAAAALDRATAYRLLQIMIARGYVHRDLGTKRYYTTLDFNPRLRGNLPAAAARTARPILQALHLETSASINLASLAGTQVRVSQAYTGRHKKIDDEIQYHDRRFPAHATASGKLMLALRPQAEVRRIYQYTPLHAYTARTLSDLPALEKDLLQVRERGYAVCDCEFTGHIVCVGTTVRTTRQLGDLALSMSFPASKVNPQNVERLLGRLRTAADEIGRVLDQWSGAARELANAV